MTTFPKMKSKEENQMFDPQSIGFITKKDILFSRVMKSKKKRPDIQAVLRIQGYHHAVILRSVGKYDQLVADRLKWLCNLRPLHVVMVDLPLKRVTGKYFMFAASFRVTSNEDGGCKINFIEDRTLTEYEEEVPMNLWSRDFRLELCKIMLFRYIIGVKQNGLENIIIRDSFPMSTNEGFIGNNPLSEEMIDKCFFEDLIQEARESVTSDFDLASMKGIVLQTRQVEVNTKYRGTGKNLNLSAKRLIELIEEKIDIVSTCSVEHLKLELRCLA